VSSGQWEACVRALLYPVIFDPDPSSSVDRILSMIVDRRALGATRAEYLESVRLALASDVQLSTLLPQDHPEAVVRRYLAEVERRLTSAT